MGDDPCTVKQVNVEDVSAHIAMHLAGLQLDLCIINYPKDHVFDFQIAEWALKEEHFERCRIKTYYNLDTNNLELVDPNIITKYSAPRKWKVYGVFIEQGLALTKYGVDNWYGNFEIGVDMLMKWRHPDFNLVTTRIKSVNRKPKSSKQTTSVSTLQGQLF